MQEFPYNNHDTGEIIKHEEEINFFSISEVKHFHFHSYTDVVTGEPPQRIILSLNRQKGKLHESYRTQELERYLKGFPRVALNGIFHEIKNFHFIQRLMYYIFILFTIFDLCPDLPVLRLKLSDRSWIFGSLWFCHVCVLVSLMALHASLQRDLLGFADLLALFLYGCITKNHSQPRINSLDFVEFFK